MMEATYDITIIGGGPVGMFAGFYAGLRDVKVQIIESLEQLGGQVSAIYPEKTILDVAGYPKITGKDLISNLKAQLAEVDTEVKLKQTVLDVESVGDEFKITTNQEVTMSKSILIATGVGSFNPRKLAVDNADEFEDKQLFYGVTDLDKFKDQSVLVAGGGDSAIDLALLLNSVSPEVYILHRRDQFRAMEHSVKQLQESSVKLLTPYLIKGLEPVDQQVKVIAEKMKTKEPLEVVVDKLVVNYGFKSQDKVNDNWSIDLAKTKGQINVSQTGQTNLKNIVAVGDVATFDGKQALISTGFGEAPIAINHLISNLYPDRRGAMHSTSLNK